MYVNKSRTLTCIRFTWNILPNKLEACVICIIFRSFRHDSVIRSQHRDAIVISTCRVWEHGIELLAYYGEENNCRSIFMCHMVDFALAYHLICLVLVSSLLLCIPSPEASRTLGITSRSWIKIANCNNNSNKYQPQHNNLSGSTIETRSDFSGSIPS